MAGSSKNTSLDLMVYGSTGLPQFGGYLFDEWDRALQGPKGMRVLREMMDNDSVIGAILFSLEMLIRQVQWKVKPGGDAQSDELIESSFDDMDRSWEDTLSEILTFLGYGFSAHEVIYKRRTGGDTSQYDDGMIGWDSWPMRGQETVLRWEFDALSRATALVQLGPPDWITHTIPMSKLLLFRTTTRRNNPQGRSILRNAHKDWYTKKHIEAIEAIGIERDIAGLPVMYAPSDIMAPDASDADKATYELLKTIVSNIRRDEQEGLILPSDRDDETKELLYELKLISSSGQRQFNIDGTIARKDQRLTMTTMADFLTLGHERVGSNALAQEKGKMFVAAISGWLSVISSVVNKIAIPRLLALNGLSPAVPPILDHGKVERPDIDMLGNFILHLQQAGMPLDFRPGSELMKQLMDVANLPEPPDFLTGPVGAPGGDDSTIDNSSPNYDSTPTNAPVDNGSAP